MNRNGCSSSIGIGVQHGPEYAHQYQREIKTVSYAGGEMEYIEVTLSDIETANRLAHDILGRTLDELPPQTRKLLKQIQQLVQAECEREKIDQNHFRFSRKTIRDFTQWSDGQLKIHCRRLEEMEYLLVHRGGRGQSIEYELLYNGEMDSDQAQLMGLFNPKSLHYDKEKIGVNDQKLVPSQGEVSPKSDPVKTLNPTPSLVYSESSQSLPKCTFGGL
jgi:DNA primase